MSYYAPFAQPINYYNPSFPNALQGQNYAQQAYGNQQQNVQTQGMNQIPQTDCTMIWVLGQNEAESYPVAPNCQVVLWDKNAPTIYVKSMSSNGIPSMRTLDFTERVENAKNHAKNSVDNLGDNFVKIDDFNALRSDFLRIEGEFNKIMEKQTEISGKTTSKTKNNAQKVKDGDQ